MKNVLQWCLALVVMICLVCPGIADAAAPKKKKPAEPVQSADPMLQALETEVMSCNVKKVQQILEEKPPINARVATGGILMQQMPGRPVLATSIDTFNIITGKWRWRECADTFVALHKAGADLWVLDSNNKPIIASLDSLILLNRIGKEAVDLNRRSAIGNAPLTLMIGQNGQRLERAMANYAKYGKIDHEEEDLMRLASYYLAESDVNSKNKFGQTAAMIAAEGGYPHILWSLAAHGADFKLKDKGGHDLVHFAKLSGNIDAVTMVRKAQEGDIEPAPVIKYDPRWLGGR